MKNCGIIAEYNPFHNGHLLHIKTARSIFGAENIIVVMSGNFVQRGEPAICDKYARTKAALLNGADVVIELPIFFATSSAEFFAKGAVNILHNCGIVDSICFGSENGDIDMLSSLAESLICLEKNPVFKQAIKEELQKGVSFPVARQKAMDKMCELEEKPVLYEPNDILAVEYLKAIYSLKSPITPLCIKREIAHYHSKTLSSVISSATAIRSFVFDGIKGDMKDFEALEGAMPKSSFEIFVEEINKGVAPNRLDNYSDVLQYIVRSSDADDISKIFDISEGLENRIISFVGGYKKISDIVTGVKTKRYTFTKLQRAVLHLLLGITTEDFNYFDKKGGPQYIRVLGFKSDKGYLIKELSEKATLPLVMNLKYAKNILNQDAMKMLNHEIRTTDIYNLGLEAPRQIGYEYTIPLCII